MGTKTVNLEKLERQQAILSEKIRAHKKETAIKYGSPFVEKVGDGIDPKLMAKLADVVAAVGFEEALNRLS